MTARAIVAALGGRWRGSYGMALCLNHDDRNPSLKVWEGERGPLVYCFAGCDWRDIRQALSIESAGPNQETRSIDGPGSDHGRCKKARALKIWHTSIDAHDTLVETYLACRGITLSIPPSIRFIDSLFHDLDQTFHPAMVAAVQDLDANVVAIHRTYLRDDGVDKAPVAEPKLALGGLVGGAVRLGPVKPAIGIAEGVETGLAVQQVFGIPVWVALGSRLHRVDIPDQVVEIQIYSDNGEAGRRAADKARERFEVDGKRVFVRPPPDPHSDWNDALKAGVL